MANRDRLWGIVYVLPALALVLSVIAYPLASVIYHAFTEWDGIEPPVWIGFENFTALVDDPVFRTSLRNNALFALSVPIQVVVPMVLAWLIHERIPGWRFFRSTFFLPAVISTVVVGLSPVVPLTTTPSLPCAIRWAAIRDVPSRSTDPSSRNAVAMAVSRRP